MNLAIILILSQVAFAGSITASEAQKLTKSYDSGVLTKGEKQEMKKLDEKIRAFAEQGHDGFSVYHREIGLNDRMIKDLKRRGFAVEPFDHRECTGSFCIGQGCTEYCTGNFVRWKKK